MYSDSRRRLILALFILSLQALNIDAVPCANYNITHQLHNDSLIIGFSSNDLLKLRRTIWCSSNSSEELIHGCAHQCSALGYGHQREVWIALEADNETRTTCSIDYVTELQPASLAYLYAVGDRVRFGISRPIGSFDYVLLRCINNESFVLFNNTIPDNNGVVIVECSFLPDVPLMNLVLETFKVGFNSRVVSVTREIPLPISFTYDLESLLLTIAAEATPCINLNSSYELNLMIHQQGNASNMKMIAQVTNLNPRNGGLFRYGLVPNTKYTIIFVHTAMSTGYTQTNATFTPVYNGSYPFAVKNVNVHQNNNDAIVSWDDPHHPYDWIGFSISCNSTVPAYRNVYRNTSYRCPPMLTNQSNVISIQTQITLLGSMLNSTAILNVDVRQLPDRPSFNVINQTETSITFRKLSNALPPRLEFLEYRIQCGADSQSEPLDIRANEYQCQSLEPGTSYLVTFSVLDTEKNLQRSNTVFANTLLERSQYKNHYYSSSDVNGTRSIVIEWIPPTKNFDIVQVMCPPQSERYDYNRTSPTMYFKCTVASGSSFSVTFITIKKNLPSVLFVFTDIAPVDPVTIKPSQNGTTTQVTGTRVTDRTTTAGTSPVRPINFTVSTTGTWIPPSRTSTSDVSAIPNPSSTSSVLTETTELARWRTYAIIAFVLSGFLLFVSLALAVLASVLCCRNR